MKKPILDPCCGGKMFWFNKNNPNVLFVDKRDISTSLCDGRKFEVKPDVIADFTTLPFDNEAFWHIVFDPPHLKNAAESGWQCIKYGKLPKEWKPYLKQGFDECWRILKTNGTLVFKWNEDQIKVSEIIKCIGREPLYGHKSGKQQKTHWLVFMKLG